MTNATRPLLATMAAMDLPEGADVPDWVHLLPGDNTIRTFDGRGPYRVADAAAVIAASLSDERGMLIDENHSTDKIGQQGGVAPARGWIKELQARADGIWGRVEWNPSGRALLADRAYRGISPVFFHTEAGEVLQILRASLTNVPNIRNLTALNMEAPPVTVSLNARLAPLLGLAATATDDQIVAAIPARTDTALQSAMTALGTALGVDGGNGTAVLAAVQALQSSQATVATQATQIATQASQIAELQAAQKRGKADAWMDGLIAARKLIPAEKREVLITLHMQDAAQAELIASGYAEGGPITFGAALPAGATTTFATHSDVTAAANRHIAAQKAAGHDITFTQAVQAVTEGRA